MLKYIAVITMLFCTSALAFDNIRLPTAIATEIPTGWHVFASVKGELSKDELVDYAIIIEKNTDEPHKLTRFHIISVAPYINSHATFEEESFRAPRRLLAYIGLDNAQFVKKLDHSDWVERADFGGMFGDSFDGLEINNGSILLKAFGGSREKWQRSMRIRFQENNWRLIGLTDRMVDGMTLKSEEFDRNLLNYKVKVIKWDQDEKTEDYWDVIDDKTKIYLSNSATW